MRILTWNLWWRFGAWEDRLEAISAVMRECRPDICCLQEVWATTESNQASVLAARHGFGQVWAWARSAAPGPWQNRIGDQTVEFANAILSRWPIAEQRQLDLPGEAGVDEGRHALLAVIDTPQDPIVVITTQLASPAHASALRVAQVRELAMWSVAAPTTSYPIVITGDFNALPESDEVRLFEGHLTSPIIPGRVLIDAWRYADSGDPGYTWSRANPHVAATFEPDARIDYVFVGSPGPAGRGRVRSVRVAGQRPIGDVWPSDHAAVLVELED